MTRTLDAPPFHALATVFCGTVFCGTVLCGTVLRGTVLCGTVFFGTAFSGGTSLMAGEDAPANAARPPRAARSVHLWYQAPPAVWFQNEVVVEQSQNGSYFMACGWQHGYFGMQQLGSPDQKVILFSVWDPGQQNDPNRVAEELRVKVLHQGEGVRVKRFGGEGTGAQSFFDYKWKVGETCRFAIRAEPQREVTAYSAYFYLNEQKAWKHLATFQTQTGGASLRGFYSFIEDFRRDGTSPQQRRAARFRNGWVQAGDGGWRELTQVVFTADQTPLANINAQVADDGFRLETGGDTKQQTTLRSRLQRAGSELPQPAIEPPIFPPAPARPPAPVEAPPARRS